MLLKFRKLRRFYSAPNNSSMKDVDLNRGVMFSEPTLLDYDNFPIRLEAIRNCNITAI